MERTEPLYRLRASTWLGIAAVNGLLAVAAGAFGAHGLEARVPAADLAVFRTAAQYHMYHALVLLAVAWRAEKAPGALFISLAGWSFLCGIMLFCGSLYLLGASGSRRLVLLTPLGGLAFMLGWALLIWSARADREA